MHLAVREDDIPRAESLVARVGKDYADSAMFAVAEGDTGTIAKLLAEARSEASVAEVAGAVRQISHWVHRPDAAEPFARVIAARPDRVMAANMALAEDLVAQGRWAAADSALVIAESAATEGRARLLRGLRSTLPFLNLPRADLETIRADVAAWDPAKQPGPPGPVSDLMPQVRRYVLGLLASRLGDPAAALREAARLEASPVLESNRVVTRSLAAAVRADAALAARRPADALKALEAVRGDVPLDLTRATGLGEDYARFLRGEALIELGNDGEARRWLENGFVGTADEMAFLAPVSLRLAELYERTGERQKAIDSYSRFVRLWGACDQRLRPAVDGARERLAKLTAEPRS
jgi:tetratricopeptide (TPR) repeat protein